MIKIEKVLDIPEFMKVYSEHSVDIESLSRDMCELIIKPEYTKIERDHNIYYEAICKEINSCDFIYFYFDKKSIDIWGYCNYEEELEISQSVSKETFRVLIDGEEKNLLIESFMNDKITLLEIK